MKLLKITLWGPKRLRAILKQIEAAINERTPKAGLGTRAREEKDGVMIYAEVGVSGTAEATAEGTLGGKSGTSIDVYGAFNGAPALFHLLQSTPPTVPPP